MRTSIKTPLTKTWFKNGAFALLGGCLLALTGCMSKIDTSGPRPPQKATQADYDKQIKTIQDDPRMAADVKAMSLENIRKSEIADGLTPPASLAAPSSATLPPIPTGRPPTGAGHP